MSSVLTRDILGFHDFFLKKCNLKSLCGISLGFHDFFLKNCLLVFSIFSSKIICNTRSSRGILLFARFDGFFHKKRALLQSVLGRTTRANICNRGILQSILELLEQSVLNTLLQKGLPIFPQINGFRLQ